MSEGNGLKDLLAKIKVEDKLGDDQDVNINFNYQTGGITVSSKKMTVDGLRPLFEWRMTPNSGEIEEIERDQDNTSEKVVVLNIDSNTLKTESESYDQALKDLVIQTTLPEPT